MAPPDKLDRREKLIEAGMTLASELSLDAVLRRIVDLAVDITGARYGAIGILGDAGRIEDFITIGLTEAEREAIGDLPVGRGILGVLIEHGSTIRMPDIAADPRSSGFPPNHPPMHSFLGAPISIRGETFGRIYLTEKQGATEFGEDDASALEVLAAQAAIAIENARLAAEATRARAERQRLAVLEDRERIAKELHDGVIQSLFAVGMGLQATAEIAGDPTVTERIDESVNEVDRVIGDLRNYIFGLKPGILADRQLDQALRVLAADLEAKSGIAVALSLDAGLAAELASHAGDIVQLTREALSNIGRHAGATTCRVSLYRDGNGNTILEVDDDGHGFDIGSLANTATGNGLKNIRERALAMSGSADIHSSPDGTTVTVTLPA
jgi:signal transduction histidine kinase